MKWTQELIDSVIWRKDIDLFETKMLQQNGMSSAGICMSKYLEELDGDRE